VELSGVRLVRVRLIRVLVGAIRSLLQ